MKQLKTPAAVKSVAFVCEKIDKAIGAAFIDHKYSELLELQAELSKSTAKPKAKAKTKK
jgi:hypothetical protein